MLRLDNYPTYTTHRKDHIREGAIDDTIVLSVSPPRVTTRSHTKPLRIANHNDRLLSLRPSLRVNIPSSTIYPSSKRWNIQTITYYGRCTATIPCVADEGRETVHVYR